MEQIIYGNIRVQILSENIVRIEYGKNGSFCDENTFFIPNKTAYTGGVTYTQEEGVICFGEYELYLPENAKSLKGVRLEKNGKRIYTYKKRCRIRRGSSFPRAGIRLKERANILSRRTWRISI